MTRRATEWYPLGDGSLLAEEADKSLGHVVGRSTYLWVFGALIILTGISVLVANVDLGVFNLFFAIFIASIKAVLVALFFMHVKWEGKLIWITVFYTVIVVALLIGGTVGDFYLKAKEDPIRASDGANISHQPLPTVPPLTP